MLRTACAAMLLSASSAAANPASIVPSAADPGNPIDLHITVDYDYQSDKSDIRREVVGVPLGPIPDTADLKFKQFRHVLTPKMDLGIYKDTWLSVALPITIAQARELEFAPGVDRDTSTTVQDGLLPAGGFDADDLGTPLTGNTIFRGKTRQGLSQVYLGVGIAPMNQARDPSKPTWKLGADVRLAIGKIMQFNEARVADENGVSKGVHELRLWTTFSRQFKNAETWLDLYWQVPLRARDGSLFDDPGFGATNVGLGQIAAIRFGVEPYIVNDRANGNRISLDLGAAITGHFEGRDYTEMWEVFALAGDASTMRPLVLDADPVEAEKQALSHPGISNHENYLETSAKIALRAKLGSAVRFAATVDLSWKTDHAISFADAGIDLPTCGTGVAGACEDEDNDLVNPGTAEVNPLHAQIIDLVGHRYQSVDNFTFVIGVHGIVMF